MEAKILMNKNTLAALKIDLEEYKEALPVFEMKEQQLKSIVHAVEEGIDKLKHDIQNTNEQIKSWVGVMNEEGVELHDLLRIKEVVTEKKEIVGIEIDTFVTIDFERAELDIFEVPLWVDDAIEVIIDQTTKKAILELEQKKYDRLIEELAEARRMRNALKEVFIPETKSNMRKIEIFLGDVERLSIGCAKLVKKKKQRKQASA